MTEHFNPQSGIPPDVLASDLDGTLIPIDRDPHNLESMRRLERAKREIGFGLIYATGRPIDSALNAIREFSMPKPEWILSDVGTTINHRVGNEYTSFECFQDHLHERTHGVERQAIEELLQPVHGLKLQSPENQKRFKISYECPPERTRALADEATARLQQAQLPFACLASLDPFDDRGLLDVLPANVSKSYALIWLSRNADFDPDEVVYAGDSGNDLAALTSGFRSIVVANATKGLVEEARKALSERGLVDRLYAAEQRATSGVLEGCIHFGLISED